MMPEHYICTTCGVQYRATDVPPEKCLICTDERQYIGASGQTWTTLAALQTDRHNTFKKVEPNLYRIRTEPSFGIGQGAHLVCTPEGNVLWDCITLVDDATVKHIQDWGGIFAIAISHPHFYSGMVEWSKAFGDVPIYLHEQDEDWIMRQDERIILWGGEVLKLIDGLTLVHGGGHFEGSSMLHWAGGAEGQGVLLSADTIGNVADNRFVTFMYSYPNYLPLHPNKVHAIWQAVEPFEFDRLYGGFGGSVPADAKAAVKRSAERYIKLVTEE